MKIEEIARICHEANRALCETHGDISQVNWEHAPGWQRQSAIKGVQFAIENPDKGPEEQHIAWMEAKKADGWKYGPVKDPDKKEHPCMVPYSCLPSEQQLKDHVFLAIVQALEPSAKKRKLWT